MRRLNTEFMRRVSETLSDIIDRLSHILEADTKITLIFFFLFFTVYFFLLHL